MPSRTKRGDLAGLPHVRETGYAASMPVQEADVDTREYLNVCYLPGIADLSLGDELPQLLAVFSTGFEQGRSITSS
ncbi:MAG: hypothetical protein B7X67_06175 [Rhizobiales bacterium 39-66-18]|jgi:hypothetical protein|nr:MAG: hypothetical protein B7X67_06175 [Rhizobiales bacterium 39-66-18]